MGGVTEADDSGLVVDEVRAELVIAVLLDANLLFVWRRYDLMLLGHLKQHLPCLLHRFYLGPGSAPVSPPSGCLALYTQVH
jgi:hypothetical protein